jgi:hypothetical protein
MDEMEVPEPYRSDLRFTYLIWTVASLLQKAPPKLEDIYKDMRQLLTNTAAAPEADHDQMKSAIMAWANKQGGKVTYTPGPGAE